MATVLGTWGEPEHAEASLMRAGMAAALGPQAELEGVTINYSASTVDVVVRLPDGQLDGGPDLRIAWVSAKLARLVTDVFGEDLTLDHVHIVEADTPDQNSPIRPRRGDA